jgi:hypothetical protein
MARFDKEKVEDFKKAVEDYVDGMVLRQREVSPSCRPRPRDSVADDRVFRLCWCGRRTLTSCRRQRMRMRRLRLHPLGVQQFLCRTKSVVSAVCNPSFVA